MSGLIPDNWRAALLDVTNHFHEWLEILLPNWQHPNLKRLVAWGVLTTSAAGFALYASVRLFCDWLVDDLMLIYGIIRTNKAVGGIYGAFKPTSFLKKHAYNIPNKKFILFENQSYTFLETHNLANQYAHALHDAGLSPDAPAAVFMKNRPELLFCFYGCLELTVPLSFININLKDKALIHCIKEGNSKFLITDDDPELLDAVNDVSAELNANNIRVLVIGHSTRYKSLSDDITNSSCDPINVEVSAVLPSTVAAFIFTSGTTGLPKAAKITYNRMARGAGIYILLGATKHDICYSPLPLYHSQNLLITHNFALLKGATFAFAKKFSATGFWEDCRRYDATVIAYIGETCRYLLTKPKSDLDTQHKVRLASGNGLRQDIWKEFTERFNIPRIGEFYAATEGTVGSINLRNKFGSCGRMSNFMATKTPMPSYHFLKYDPDTEEILRDDKGLCVLAALGEPGVLVGEITKRAAFDGYTNKQQSQRKVLHNVIKHGDMYFNTGDLLLRDKDYYVYFVDRVGDTFRWKGENVSTQEVANLLTDVDFLQDCTVYGVSIPNMDGKCGMAALMLKPNVTVSPELLKMFYQHVTHCLPSYAQPVFIRFIPEINMTGTYKHQKVKLKQEGYDVNVVDDVYVINRNSGVYVKLDQEIYGQIQTGKCRV